MHGLGVAPVNPQARRFHLLRGKKGKVSMAGVWNQPVGGGGDEGVPWRPSHWTRQRSLCWETVLDPQDLGAPQIESHVGPKGSIVFLFFGDA